MVTYSLVLTPTPCRVAERIISTGWSKKLAQKFLYALTLPNINNLQNYFTVRIRRKFVLIQSLKIPPHLKCVVARSQQYLVKYQCLNNKATSITIQEINNRKQRVLKVGLIYLTVSFCRFYVRCSMCPRTSVAGLSVLSSSKADRGPPTLETNVFSCYF